MHIISIIMSVFVHTTVFFLLLTVVRWFLFGIILVSTAGRVHFWIFPYLNDEKRGFVDSFKPLYSVERKNLTELDTQ